MSLLRHKSPTNQACTARRLAGGDLHSLGAGWCYFTPLRHHPTTKKKKIQKHTHIPSLPPPPSPPPFALQISPPFTTGLELRTLDRRIAATENPKRSIAGGGVQSSATERTPPLQNKTRFLPPERRCFERHRRLFPPGRKIFCFICFCSIFYPQILYFLFHEQSQLPSAYDIPARALTCFNTRLNSHSLQRCCGFPSTCPR